MSVIEEYSTATHRIPYRACFLSHSFQGVLAVVTTNEPELVAFPPGVVIEITPVFEPFGTTTVADVEITPVGTAVEPPVNVTRVAPVRFVPVILIEVPTGPEVGVNAEMVGG